MKLPNEITIKLSAKGFSAPALNGTVKAFKQSLYEVGAAASQSSFQTIKADDKTKQHLSPQ